MQESKGKGCTGDAIHTWCHITLSLFPSHSNTQAAWPINTAKKSHILLESDCLTSCCNNAEPSVKCLVATALPALQKVCDL